MTSQLFEAFANRAYFFGKFRYQIVSQPSRFSLKVAQGGPPVPDGPPYFIIPLRRSLYPSTRTGQD